MGSFSLLYYPTEFIYENLAKCLIEKDVSDKETKFKLKSFPWLMWKVETIRKQEMFLKHSYLSSTDSGECDLGF